MKRIFVVALALICLFPSIGCNNTSGEKSCNHIFGEWQFNDESHWREYTCGHDSPEVAAEHTWDGGVEIEGGIGGYIMEYTCTVCGKKDQHTNTIIPLDLRDEALRARDVAFANCANGDYVEDALNFGKYDIDYYQESDVYHLPVYRFSTLAELEDFKSKYADVFDMNRTYNEIKSFAQATAYLVDNENYWNSYDLFVIYIMTGTCSTRYGLTNVGLDGNELRFYVNCTYDPGNPYDEAMGGWFIITSLPKNMIADYTEYDSVTGRP